MGETVAECRFNGSGHSCYMRRTTIHIVQFRRSVEFIARLPPQNLVLHSILKQPSKLLPLLLTTRRVKVGCQL